MVRVTLQRLALLGLGCLLGLGAVEAALQAGAAIVRVAAPRAAVPAAAGQERRVLCVGDSNTYGLWMPERGLAYPDQMAAVWNAAPAGARLRVFNAGYPGTNSSRLRRDLPRMLDLFHPDVVFVLVGANDGWTTPVSLSDEPRGLRDRLADLLRRSRLWQLLHMLRRSAEEPRLVVAYDPTQRGGQAGALHFGDETVEMGYAPETQLRAFEADLRRNLRAVAAEGQAAGAAVVFLTYPSLMWNYGDATRVIRAFAAETGVPLIDLAASFAARCPREPCADWLFADHHPTAAGYRLMAETVARDAAPILAGTALPVAGLEDE